ncbi:MAG: spoIIIJ-associated protein, partial [Thermodesulfobacteriota bacterium]|nr:spoIIIJ-associated protein [Thermodesulfobacteriota bacterium]
MNQPLEFTGKNVTSAVEAACRQLNIPKKELKYNVISTGTTGIFGIVGRKDARIRVTVPTQKVQPSKEDKEGILSIVDEAFGQSDPKPKPKQSPPLQPKSGHRNQRRQKKKNRKRHLRVSIKKFRIWRTSRYLKMMSCYL